MDKPREPIPEDTALIASAQRCATGANVHDINCLLGTYRGYCRLGIKRTARDHKYALTVLISGRAKNRREALNMAWDFYFEARKNEVRDHGSWPKDWEKYLGPSPRPYNGDLPDSEVDRL